MSKSPDGAWKTNFFVASSRRVSQKILEIPLDKSAGMVYNICIRGYSLMVKLQLPKLAMRVRFPLLAPKKGRCVLHLPFLERTMEPRNRIKLQATKKQALSWCNLLPSLLGGVQIPVTRSKKREMRSLCILNGGMAVTKFRH